MRNIHRFAERRNLTLAEALETPLWEVYSWAAFWKYEHDKPSWVTPELEQAVYDHAKG